MVAMLKLPSTMRLPVSAKDDNGAERRTFPRKSSDARVQGFRVDHSIPAHRQPQLSLAVRDISVGGLAAITATPLQRGEKLSITFPATFGKPGWSAYGRVIRCEASSIGYRVALEFDHLQAA